MSLVSDVILDIRYEINDASKTRWTTDTPILAYVKRAVNRANRICQRNSLHFAKKKVPIPTVAGVASVVLPADFDIDIGLWRDATHTQIVKKSESQWEQIITASVLTNWMLDSANSLILLTGTPATVENLTLHYFPTVDASGWTVASTMPWDGRLDDIIVDYVSLRLKNVDEMDASADIQMMTDFENQIIQSYSSLNPTIIPSEGWL